MSSLPIKLNSVIAIFLFAMSDSFGATVTWDADKSVQTMFYKAQLKETGKMWDVWLYHNEGTYFLYR